MSTDTLYNGTVENDSIVNGFNMMRDESLSALAERMGLSLPLDMLCLCREHYKAVNKNPTVDELLFINGYVKEYRKHSEFSLIGELETDCKTVAEIYSELIEARKALSGNKAKYPFSLSEAAKTAPCLCESEKKSNTSDLSADGLFASVILPVDLCDRDAYQKRAADALKDEKISAHIAVPYTSYIRGISFLHTFLTRSKGAKLYYDCFFGDGEPSLHGIFGVYEDHFLIFSKGNKLSRLSKELEKFGLRIIVAGECDNSGRISLTKGNTVFSSVDISLINKLTEYYPERFVFNEDMSRPVGCKAEYSDVFQWNDSALSISVKNDITTDPLMSAYSTVYTAFGKAVCEGFTNSLSLTCDLAFPYSDGTDKSRGSCLATVLGVIKSQSELSVSSIECKVHSEDIDKTCLTVFVSGEKTKDGMGDRFFEYNNSIYLLKPTQTDGGLIVPESMKALCEYVKELIALGKVRSVLPFGTCSVVDALNRTVNGDIGYFLSTKEDIHAALPFAFIIETNKEIEGIRLGTTCKVTKETIAHNSDRVWKAQSSQSNTAKPQQKKKNSGRFGKAVALVAVFSFLAVSSCVSKARKKKKRADKSKNEKDKEKKTK